MKSGEMKLTPLFAASIVVLQLCGGVCAALRYERATKKYTINLDLPPSERWTEVIMDHKTELETILKYMNATSSPMLIDALFKLGKNIDQYIPPPYNEELVGIAKLLDGVSVGSILMANLYYELNAYGDSEVENNNAAMACTSIVAETLNGTILHGRNLDYDLVKYLENITITVDFQKGGNISYTGTTFAGLVGLITGQKPYKYTISLNERDQGEFWMNIVEAWMSGMDAVASFHIRDVLAQDNLSFNDAVAFMSTKPLIAPCYIVMGGVQSGEGVVLTRERTGFTDQYRLDASNGIWFLLETNYDHWTTPPSWDDRRDPGIKAMEAMTRASANGNGLYNVLSTPPVLNWKTTYTVVMSAANPQMYTTWIRHHG